MPVAAQRVPAELIEGKGYAIAPRIIFMHSQETIQVKVY